MRYTAVRCNPPIGHFQLATCKALSHSKNGNRNPHEGEAPASGSWPMLSSEMLLCSYISSILSIFLVLPVTSTRLLCSILFLHYCLETYKSSTVSDFKEMSFVRLDMHNTLDITTAYRILFGKAAIRKGKVKDR